MKTKARRTIEKYGDSAMPNAKVPVCLGTDGVVALFPAQTVGYDFYVTARYVRYTPKRKYIEYVCSCPGFKYSEENRCHHVKELQEGIESAM